jgi:hypothetical protein
MQIRSLAREVTWHCWSASSYFFLFIYLHTGHFQCWSNGHCWPASSYFYLFIFLFFSYLTLPVRKYFWSRRSASSYNFVLCFIFHTGHCWCRSTFCRGVCGCLRVCLLVCVFVCERVCVSYLTLPVPEYFWSRRSIAFLALRDIRGKSVAPSTLYTVNFIYGTFNSVA